MNPTRQSNAQKLIERLLAEAPPAVSSELFGHLTQLGWKPRRDGLFTQEVDTRDGAEALVVIRVTDGAIEADGVASLEYETRRGPATKEVDLDLPCCEREGGESSADFVARATDTLLAAAREASVELDPEDGAASAYDLHVKDHPMDRF